MSEINEDQIKKIRKFVKNRRNKILSEKTPLELPPTEKLVLHIIPVNNFLNNQKIDLFDVSKLNKYFPPLKPLLFDGKYNFDGYLSFDSKKNNKYTQIFFNGIVEFVNSEITEPYDSKNYFEGAKWEYQIVETIKNGLDGFKIFSVNPPVLIFMSLLNFNGILMDSTGLRSPFHGYPVDRDNLIFPEILIENLENPDVPKLMKPTFDLMWNAFGHDRSYHYNQNGDWIS